MSSLAVVCRTPSASSKLLPTSSIPLISSISSSSVFPCGFAHESVRNAREKPTTSSKFQHNLKKDDVPTSSKPYFYNRFDYADDKNLHKQDAEIAPKHPPANTVDELVEAVNHPHNHGGFFNFDRYAHYNRAWEPVVQRHADLTKGELVSGSNFYRNRAWVDDNEPAIKSVARFDPQNIRPIGYAENVPNPESTIPKGVPDFTDYRLPPNSPDRRGYTYLVTASAWVMTATLTRSFISLCAGMWWIPAGMLFAGKSEVDISKIEVGRSLTVDYRGKPCFVKRRTAEEIQLARDDDRKAENFRDPELDSERTQKPEWLIVSGVCTHLGCIPHEGGEYGGYFCPCHGSHYDSSGRIRAGPAATNLVVPSYKFMDDNTILIGD